MTTTKVMFDMGPAVVKLESLKPGQGFQWEGKLYIKLQDDLVIRVRGDQNFSAFASTRLGFTTLVQPLNVEIKFSF